MRFSSHHILMMHFSFSLVVSGFITKNQVSRGICIYIFLFHQIALFLFSAFMSMPGRFSYDTSSVDASQTVIILDVLLLHRTQFQTSWVFLFFCMKLNIVPLIFGKNCAKVFMGIMLKVYIAFCSMAIFTKLFLLIHEDGRLFFMFDIFNFFPQICTVELLV